jgi:hypothetical protein
VGATGGRLRGDGLNGLAEVGDAALVGEHHPEHAFELQHGRCRFGAEPAGEGLPSGGGVME